MAFSPIEHLRQRLQRNATPLGRRTLSDRALAHRLFQTFENDLENADVQGLHFYVQNGVVTLYGTVRHDLDRELLTDLVRDIPGVRQVRPHLQTVAPVHRDVEPAATPEPTA